MQAGFLVLIAPGKGEGFADIFEGNAFNNGLLPIELPVDAWKEVASALRAEGPVDASVDLKTQSLTLHLANGGERSFAFEIPEAQRNRLLSGLDAIAETLEHDSAIGRYEAVAPSWVISQNR